MDSWRSLPKAGTTSRSLSKAELRLFMRRLSRALAAKRRFFITCGATVFNWRLLVPTTLLQSSSSSSSDWRRPSGEEVAHGGVTTSGDSGVGAK